MKWFRFYDEVLDDPKVQLLPLPLYKAWTSLLCVANRSEPRGILPDGAAIAFHLRIAEAKVDQIIRDLITAELIDVTPDGRYAMHNWNGRQRVTDDVAKRVQKHRETVTGNVTHPVTGNVTHPLPRARATETETDTEIAIAPAHARAKPTNYDRIHELADAYRDGLGIPQTDAGWNTGGNMQAAAQAEQIAAQAISAAEIRDATAWLLDSWRHDGSRPIRSAMPKLVPHVINAMQAWRDDGSPSVSDIKQRRTITLAASRPRAPVPIRDKVIRDNEFEAF